MGVEGTEQQSHALNTGSKVISTIKDNILNNKVSKSVSKKLLKRNLRNLIVIRCNFRNDARLIYV